MLSVREQYWRYSLVALIVGLGTVVFVELTPFLGGLMGAATIYVLLRGQMCRLTGRHGWRRSAAAWLLLGEAVCCFLVPISLLVWMVAERVQRLTLDPRQLVVSARHLAALVQERTGYDLWQESNLRSLLSELPHLGQWLLGGVTGFAVNVVVLLFVLYFMLLGGRRMEEYIRELLPFSRGVGSDALHEVRMIVRSNAIGVPLLAVVQGGVALAGYLLFGVPDPLFWGVLTCLATIIPVVGTALVWVPLALWLGLGGHTGAAVGLAAYGVAVVTQSDNVVRLVLQRRMADIHPLITVFGVVIGLSLFGFMGVIFGPLLLSMFVFCVHVFKRLYLDRRPDAGEPSGPSAPSAPSAPTDGGRLH